jgi:hypothetical protein
MSGMIHGYLKIDAKKCLSMCELWDKKRLEYNDKCKKDVVDKYLGKRFWWGQKLNTPEEVLEWYNNRHCSIFTAPFDFRSSTKYDVEDLMFICKAGDEVFVSQNLWSKLVTDLESTLK